MLVERLTHYFRTYKMVDGEDESTYVREVYGRERAHAVVDAAIQDYTRVFGHVR